MFFKLSTLLMLIAVCNGMSIDTQQQTQHLVKRQGQPEYICSNVPTRFDNTAIVSYTAQQGFVYVDPAHPIDCAGRVHTIETCFRVNDALTGGLSIDLVLLRPIQGGYHVRQVIDLPITNLPQSDDDTAEVVLYCMNVTVPSSESLIVQSGDLLGFRTKNSIEIVFSIFPFSGQLSSVTITPVLGVETVLSGQITLDNRQTGELPMFRALIVEDNSENSQTTQPPDCTTTTSNDNGDDNNGPPELNFNNIYNTVFTSFVIATVVAIIIIFVLIVVLFACGMSLCKEKYKCLYKVCCCCCRRKKKKGFVRKLMHV